MTANNQVCLSCNSKMIQLLTSFVCSADCDVKYKSDLCIYCGVRGDHDCEVNYGSAPCLNCYEECDDDDYAMTGYCSYECQSEDEDDPVDPYACPGCVCIPGDGVTDGCDDNAGCGYMN